MCLTDVPLPESAPGPAAPISTAGTFGTIGGVGIGVCTVGRGGCGDTANPNAD